MRKQIKQIEQIIERYTSNYSVERTKRHFRITVRRGPHSRVFFAPASVGDHRALKNFESETRAAVRELQEQPA